MAHYRYGSVLRTYLPDVFVLVGDGLDDRTWLGLFVEIKRYRGEDAPVE